MRKSELGTGADTSGAGRQRGLQGRGGDGGGTPGGQQGRDSAIPDQGRAPTLPCPPCSLLAALKWASVV